MRRLTICDGSWGRVKVIRSLPSIRLVKNAIYIPWRADREGWGVFDDHGHRINEAQNFRGAGYEISGEAMRFSEKDACAAVWHDLETMIYGGVLLRHFGHFIVNSLPRFWPALQVRCPPFLCHFQGPRSYFEDGFAAKLLAPIGVALPSIFAPEQPMRIRNLYIPESAFHEQMASHSILREMGDRTAMAYGAVDQDDIDCVYLSKTKLIGGVGRFKEEDFIEDKMRSLGAMVIYPETLSIPEQIRMLSRSSLITGTVGSALHLTLFASRPRKILALNPNSDVNSNFLIIDKLVGNEATYMYSDQVQSTSGKQFLTDHYSADPISLAQQFAMAVINRIDSLR